MKLLIHRSDLEHAQHLKVNNPILFALQNVTKTLWRPLECGTLEEAIPPFRRCELPAEAVQLLREYFRTGKLLPIELELEVAENTLMSTISEATVSSADPSAPSGAGAIIFKAV